MRVGSDPQGLADQLLLLARIINPLIRSDVVLVCDDDDLKTVMFNE